MKRCTCGYLLSEGVEKVSTNDVEMEANFSDGRDSLTKIYIYENIFENWIISSKIFRFLDRKSLGSCRLVSKKFNQLSTSEFRQRKMYRIRIGDSMFEDDIKTIQSWHKKDFLHFQKHAIQKFSIQFLDTYEEFLNQDQFTWILEKVIPNTKTLRLDIPTKCPLITPILNSIHSAQTLELTFYNVGLISSALADEGVQIHHEIIQLNDDILIMLNRGEAQRVPRGQPAPVAPPPEPSAAGYVDNINNRIDREFPLPPPDAPHREHPLLVYPVPELMGVAMPINQIFQLESKIIERNIWSDKDVVVNRERYPNLQHLSLCIHMLEEDFIGNGLTLRHLLRKFPNLRSLAVSTMWEHLSFRIVAYVARRVEQQFPYLNSIRLDCVDVDQEFFLMLQELPERVNRFSLSFATPLVMRNFLKTKAPFLRELKVRQSFNCLRNWRVLWPICPVLDTLELDITRLTIVFPDGFETNFPVLRVFKVELGRVGDPMHLKFSCGEFLQQFLPSDNMEMKGMMEYQVSLGYSNTDFLNDQRVVNSPFFRNFGRKAAKKFPNVRNYLFNLIRAPKATYD